jgi:transcriptional regulator NrdR family protein
MKCPECQSKDIKFCGLKSTNGGYVNSWECEDCHHKWTTPINHITEEIFNG